MSAPHAPATMIKPPGAGGPGYRQDRTGAGHWLSVVGTASGGMLRHKVQAVVIVAVLFIATASATLGLALLNANNSPITKAFAAQQGADLTVTANPADVTPAQLAATAHVAGVTAMAGPFDETTLPLEFQGQPWGQTTLVGRSAPGGPVDDVVLNAGHWANGPGQVVLAGNPAPGGGGPGSGGPVIGSTFTATGLRGAPVRLTVVGFATSITHSAQGWVTPAELPGLLPPGGHPTAQLLYRFTSAATNAQVRADAAAVTRALPDGAVLTWGSWLTAQQSEGSNAAIMEPFVIAFALIGLVMAVLIVGNVISGAVVAQYDRIGVLKSLGLTPAQVVAVYLSRIGWPALAGCVVGVVGGYALTIPVLHQSAGAYGVGSQQAPLWALILAPAGMLAITLLAAFGPALRAGRLSATEAIASGRASGTGRGYAVHRLAARLNLPRPVGLGLAAPFARPARTLVTLAAVAFGATAVIFAVGLHSSLSQAQASQSLAATVQAQVEQNSPEPGPNGVPTDAQFALAASAVNQPAVVHSNAEYGTQVKVVGFSQGVQANVFDGPSAWMGYAVISGHWYDAPGEADVNTTFLTDSGLAVGDLATVYPGSVTAGAKPVTVRIAGEVFDPSSQPRLFAAGQTLPGTATAANFWQWNVGLKPGVTVAAYAQVVDARLGGNSAFIVAPPNGGGQFYAVAIGLIGLLSLMVAVAAGLGVLNTVLMTTRDRVHDLGIFKSLGMRPGQVVIMVICWVVGPAVLAGAIAAPAAVALNTATVRAMAATAHTGIPASFTNVFPVSRLALLSLAAVAIAVLGALLPATWAARARPAAALRAE
ncbi:MAG: FtsX-like permease family protein [Trebonia sp.]